MEVEWEAIDGLWEGYSTNHAPLFAPQGLRSQPTATVADEWAAVDPFWNGYKTDKIADLKRLKELSTAVRDNWTNSNSSFTTDPLTVNWGSASPFEGPLRTTVTEEDWSQWLAHLLRTSTGPFVSALLGLPEEPPESVRREVVFSDSTSTRRIDILVENGESGVSIEVKNGDTNYRKTPETANLIEQDRSRRWSHILLVQQKRLPQVHHTFATEEITDEQPRPTIHTQDDPPVEIRYWEDVSQTLRQIVTEGAEPDDHWEASAYLFITLIEQRILDLQAVAQTDAQTMESAESDTFEFSQLVSGDLKRHINYLKSLLETNPTHE